MKPTRRVLFKAELGCSILLTDSELLAMIEHQHAAIADQPSADCRHPKRRRDNRETSQINILVSLEQFLTPLKLAVTRILDLNPVTRGLLSDLH
jgi:hypothetical protein